MELGGSNAIKMEDNSFDYLLYPHKQVNVSLYQPPLEYSNLKTIVHPKK